MRNHIALRPFVVAALLLIPTAGCAEYRISRPDFVTFVPRQPNEGTNQHFLVVPTPAGRFLAFWTQATHENDPDQRIVMAISDDRGRTWTAPRVLAGDPAGKDKSSMASWGFPFVVPATGRVYLFWNQNVGVIDARADTTGACAYMWSDDEGRTWSPRHQLTIRKSAISNPAPNAPENWVTYQCPITTSRGEVLVGFTRWASRAQQPEGGLFDIDSEIWFLRFDNILTEPDGAKLTVTTLPDGDRGLRVPRPDKPAVSVAQEPTLQELSDGRFISVMRTRAGAIYYALSADRGRTWDTPRPLRYRPGGEVVHQPLASSPLYKLADGRFVLIFHNNDGTANGGKSVTDGRRNRRPVFLAVGRENGDADHPLTFSKPLLLADNQGRVAGPTDHTQIGTYPSLFEHGGHVYFWYPDRKHFLLGKIIDDEIAKADRN